MRVASISKPITAAAVRKLIASGRLTDETKVFPMLHIKPPEGASTDQRLPLITVRHLLEHKGGWETAQLGFDPMFEKDRVKNELHLASPPGPGDVVKWLN